MTAETDSQIARFKVGHGLAIVFPPTYLVVDPTNGAFAEKLWAVIEAEGGIDELLEVFLAEGLRTLGDFAMAQIEGEGLRVVVRGQGRAVVSTDAETLPLEAGTVKTWVEAFYEESSGFALSLGEVGDETLTYRFARGVVPADELHWGDLNAGGVQLQGIEQDWVDDFEPIPTGSVPPPIEPESQPPVDPPRPQPAGTATAAAAAQAPAGEPIDDSHLDELFGATVAKTVADAAVSAVDEEGELEPSVPEKSEPVQPSQPATSEETLAPPQDQTSSGGLIDSIPGRATPAPSPQPVPTAGQMGDHDGLTVSKAQLDELRGQSEAPASAPSTHTSGPMVHAVMCAQGHPNPTKSKTCIKCQQPLTGAATTIPRPVLGSLVFSNGERIELDKPAIIGRNPKLSGSMLNEMPQSVRLEGHEAVSRTHARILLESWHVLVEDLGSKFGTVLIQPGQDPRRLAKGEQVILEPGAVIDFAEEVTATFYGSG